MTRTRSRWLAAVLVASGCRQPASEGVDAALDLASHDAAEDRATTDVSDAADAAGARDAMDITDITDITDASDVADALDVADASDDADIADVADVPVRLDVADVVDATDASRPSRAERPIDVNHDGIADLVVGAPGQAGLIGRVYLYLGRTGGIAATPSLTLTPPAGVIANFGSSVSNAGDVDGDGHDDLAVTGSVPVVDGAPSGRVFVYAGSATGLASAPRSTLIVRDFGVPMLLPNRTHLARGGDLNGDGFDDVIAGLEYTAPFQSAVVVHFGSATGPSAVPVTIMSFTSMSAFGATLAAGADYDRDGYADLAVAAPAEGVVRVFRGGMSAPAATPSVTYTGDGLPAAFLNPVVVNAGDLNRDGYADLAIATEASGGRVYVYLGSAAGLPRAPGVTLANPGSTGGVFAFPSGVGDLDGDGFAELAVGLLTTASDGRVFIFRGSASGLSTTPSAEVLTTEAPPSAFGEHCAAVGDLDGDGFSDIAVSARTAQGYAGRVFVYRGGRAGLATTPMITLSGPDGVNGFFGAAVVSAR